HFAEARHIGHPDLTRLPENLPIVAGGSHPVEIHEEQRGQKRAGIDGAHESEIAAPSSPNNVEDQNWTEQKPPEWTCEIRQSQAQQRQGGKLEAERSLLAIPNKARRGANREKSRTSPVPRFAVSKELPSARGLECVENGHRCISQSVHLVQA